MRTADRNRSCILLLGVFLFCLPDRAIAADLTSYVKPPSPPSPAFNMPTEEKIELGRRLFFDRRLSGANTISCASCHQPQFTWTDNKAFSLGETGVARSRRTPSLQDVGWNKLFARDGRIETLEGFVLGPIFHPDEMNQDLELLPAELAATPPYPDLFKAAFGINAITLDTITQSLATYVRTLRSATAPFDRWIAGDRTALNDAALAGFNLFTGKAGCAQCHTGWRFTDQGFYDIGLETTDTGRGRLEPDTIALQYAFKTPSLRNVAIRPPYMHNSSLASLAEVIDHYAAGGIARPSRSAKVQPVDLTAQEKVNLIEFLKSLTDDIRHDNAMRTQPNQVIQ